MIPVIVMKRVIFNLQESWIVANPGYSQSGRQPLNLGQKPIILKGFCQKLHGNERNCSERKRGAPN